LLVLGYIPAFIFLKYVLMGNVPEKLPAESYAKVIAVKVVFAVLLSIMASGGGGGGAFRFLSSITALPASLGGGYFIYSMVLDMFFIVLLWRGEFYGAAKMVMFNLPHIPFLTFSAVLYGILGEQGKTIRRVREDLPVRKEGMLLGHAVWLMRSIRKPVRGYRYVDVRTTYDIRPLPIKAAVYYSPKISDKDLNPHMIIAGSSGSIVVSYRASTWPLYRWRLKGLDSSSNSRHHSPKPCYRTYTCWAARSSSRWLPT